MTLSGKWVKSGIQDLTTAQRTKDTIKKINAMNSKFIVKKIKDAFIKAKANARVADIGWKVVVTINAQVTIFVKKNKIKFTSMMFYILVNAKM